MRRLFFVAVFLAAAFGARAQEDKKTDDLKPADPDTGESTVEESTLGLLPNPLAKITIANVAIGGSPDTTQLIGANVL